MNEIEIKRLKNARSEAQRFIKSVDAALEADANQNRYDAEREKHRAETGRLLEWQSFRFQMLNATAKRHSMDLSESLVVLRNRRR